MHPRALPPLALLYVLLLATAAPADELPVARASFPLLDAPAPQAPQPAPAPRPPAPTDSVVSTPTWEVTVLRPLHRVPPNPPELDRGEPTKSSKDEDSWMLSFEAVSHAPIDVGLQSVLETPVGLRFLGGYGWVPSAYIDRVMGAAADVSTDPTVSAILDRGYGSGKTWRAGIGLRPFASSGVYLDAGYCRVRLRGSLDLSGVGQSFGSYDIDSTLGLAFAELGFQGKIGGRVVLALAVGATKVLSSETRSSPDHADVRAAAKTVDEGLVRYGVLPTVGLRLGFDLI